MKKACMSNIRDPENRSKKKCVCGGHNSKNIKKSRKEKILARVKKQQRSKKGQTWLLQS